MKKNHSKNISQYNSIPLSLVLRSTAVTLALFFLIPLMAYSFDLTLYWDANTEPDLAGYKIYYGTSTGYYTTIVNVGNVLEYRITGLNQETTYYFSVTAYDTSNNESDYSVELVCNEEFPWIIFYPAIIKKSKP